MLIEVKTKVAWLIDGKARKKLETYILSKEVFAEAEYEVMTLLEEGKQDGTVDDFEITGMKVSPIKEIITQYEGEGTFIASLRDIFLQDDGSEKTVRYKVLLWANDIADAMAHTREIAQQGYDMQIDGLREVSYTYLTPQNHEEGTQEDRVTADA